MDVKFITIRHGSQSQTIAVGPGIAAEEVEGLISALFGVTGSVVGLQAQNGLVIPMSLACKNPQILPGDVFGLLVSGGSAAAAAPGKASTSAPPRPPTSTQQAPAAPSVSVPPPAPPASSAAANSSDEEPSPDSQATESAMDELIRFIAALRIKQMISKAEADALEDLLFENSSLIYAAYSVAKSAGDPTYLATVCRDIAQSLVTSAGRAACSAQEEVLEYCDKLYVMNKITESQLLYLRHLVLIRDSLVATLYDDFQRYKNPDQFAINLFRLANSHPRWSSTAPKREEDGDSEDEQSEEEEEEDEEDDEEAYAPSGRKTIHYEDSEDYVPERNPYSYAAYENEDEEEEEEEDAAENVMYDDKTALEGITQAMHRMKMINDDETDMLLDLIENEDDYVYAVFDKFENDSNVKQMQGALINRARQSLQQEREAVASAKAAQARAAAVSESNSSQDKVAAERKYVENFLGAMGVANNWVGTVPERFIVAVFASAQKGLLSTGQAKALCDLFQARYDLVLAAWEVFTVQGDVADLMDTLIRIVRGLNFSAEGTLVTDRVSDDERNEAEEDQNEEEGQDESSGGNESDTEDEEEEEGEEEEEQNDEAGDDAELDAQQKNVMQKRDAAILAVAQAKQDLLKHSLEIMVKQGIATADKAIALYKRALEGDMLIDAAIETYAGNRDVAEFLDTLNILVQYSPEELRAIMEGAAAREQQASTSSSEPRVDNVARVATGPAPSAPQTGRLAPQMPSPTAVPDNADDADLDLAQLELREVIVQLADRTIISNEARNHLLKLVFARDDRILAVHDVYSDSGDLGDMVDSLIRIARVDAAKAREAALAAEANAEKREESGIELANLRRINTPEEGGLELATMHHSPAGIFPPKNSSPVIKTGSPMSSPKSPSSPTKSTSSNTPSSPAAASSSPKTTAAQSTGSSLLTPEDHKNILDVLVKANAIQKNHYDALVRLVNVGDRRISEIFANYEATKDVPDLIVRLSKAATMLAGILQSDAESDEEEEGQGSEEESQEGSEEEDEEEEDDNNEEDEEGLDEDDRDTVETLFFNVVQRMQLNHLETTALRLAIARDDPAIRKSLESFRRTRNESELMASLRTISRDTISSTLQEAGFEGVKSPSKDDIEAEADAKRWINSRDDDDEEDEDDEENEEEDSGDNSSSEDDNNDQQEDESEESDDDDDEDEEDEEENAGSGGLSSQANRERVFPFLVSELSKDKIISTEDARTLYKLFLEKNDVLYSALDVYDLDNNIGELVDTMMNLAKLNR